MRKEKKNPKEEDKKRKGRMEKDEELILGSGKMWRKKELKGIRKKNTDSLKKKKLERWKKKKLERWRKKKLERWKKKKERRGAREKIEEER